MFKTDCSWFDCTRWNTNESSHISIYITQPEPRNIHHTHHQAAVCPAAVSVRIPSFPIIKSLNDKTHLFHPSFTGDGVCICVLDLCVIFRLSEDDHDGLLNEEGWPKGRCFGQICVLSDFYIWDLAFPVISEEISLEKSWKAKNGSTTVDGEKANKKSTHLSICEVFFSTLNDTLMYHILSVNAERFPNWHLAEHFRNLMQSQTISFLCEHLYHVFVAKYNIANHASLFIGFQLHIFHTQ